MHLSLPVESWSTKARQPQIRGGPSPQTLTRPCRNLRGEGGGPTLPLFLATGARAHESEDEERERLTSNSNKSTTQRRRCWGADKVWGALPLHLPPGAWPPGHPTDDGGAHARLLPCEDYARARGTGENRESARNLHAYYTYIIQIIQ